MVRNWLGTRWFNLVHGRNLVYNTCWEDPRLDRVALDLSPSDEIVMITSAGCNALDYALCGPAKIDAVDMNPRQNSLLELKLAGIRALDYATFWELFGRGKLDNCKEVYHDALRPQLSESARSYWDRRTKFFSGKGWQDSFYFHGTSGAFARVVNTYIDRVAKVRDPINKLLASGSVEEQKKIYHDLKKVFWTKFIRWAVGRDTTLSMLGVPQAQRKQVDKYYPGGITGFIEDSVEAVFAELPISDNYFWRVYLTGEYSRECCPEYLKPENFAALKGGLADRIETHTCSVLDFLRVREKPVSRYVLLDHMDWLAHNLYPVLVQEWQAIFDKAAPQARILWRSGGLRAEFIDTVPVMVGRKHHQVGDLLRYNPELAAGLHVKDRVHTYGSFYIADVVKA